MRRLPKVRLPFLALAAILFLVISFHSTPSDPAVSTPQDLSTPQASAPSTEEVAHWMAAGSNSTPSGFHAFRFQDLPRETSGATGVSVGHHAGLFLSAAEPDVADAQRRFLYRMPYGAAIS